MVLVALPHEALFAILFALWKGLRNDLPTPKRSHHERHHGLARVSLRNVFPDGVDGSADFVDADNPDAKRAETVGFAAEHKSGRWVLFRMCKGSTDDKATEKILATDINPSSSGAANGTYVLSEEEADLHNLRVESAAVGGAREWTK